MLDQSTTDFYYKEIATLVKAGGWSVDFIYKKCFLDEGARKILEIPDNYQPSLYKLLDFYASEKYKEKAIKTFTACSKGVEFDEHEKMITYTGKELWVRTIGKPVYNSNHEIIGIQGVFRDITIDKLRELENKKAMKTVEAQNARLLNFAHIVSHNLRSHSSNFQLTLTLLEEVTDEAEKKELMDGLQEVSESLNTTITHLSEIVTINTKAISPKKGVSLARTFELTEQTLHEDIKASGGTFYTDFSKLETVNAVPAYLDSIFLNLMTNAIKYRSPHRTLRVDIYSTIDDQDVKKIIFKDNGIGIDLALFGKNIFNMYQTFHNYKGAVGIGLFMTRNQVEAMGGSISVESTVDKGTTFTITLL